MRALRGMTVVALTALAVSFASMSATAAESDDGPLAAAVPGSATSYVAPEPTAKAISAAWAVPDGSEIPIPRGTGLVEIVLPDEALALVADGVRVEIVAATPPTRAIVSTREYDPASVVIDLDEVVASAAGLGVPVIHQVELGVTGSTSNSAVGLRIDLLLTEAAPTEVVVVPLELRPDSHRAFTFEATPVRVADGTRVTLVAEPGFFDLYPATVDARVYDQSYYPSVSVLDSVAVSDDGAELSLTIPDGALAWARRLSVDIGDSATPVHRMVWVELLPMPTDVVAAYVTAVYNDLFGRDPDPTGMVGWTNALMRGVPYSAVSDSITASDEFRMGLITDAYAHYLGRLPDPEGLAGWLRAMNRGLHIQQMEAGFLGSQEYFDVWGEGTNAGWIRALYLDVLGREATAAEVQAWLPAIARDGREQVSRGFLYSTEKLETDVDGYYRWLLRRPLDPVGRAGWVRAIQSGHRVEEIIAGIIASDEYRGNVPVG